MTAAIDKKEMERRIIERARGQSAIFPPGGLFAFENPDFLIPNAKIAIEVTQLLPEKPPGARFTAPQLDVFQKHIVADGRQIYYSDPGAPDADVLVYFRNDWTVKSDRGQMAQGLARLVSDSYPYGERDCITLNGALADLDVWPEGLSVVRIARIGRNWTAAANSDVQTVTNERLAECVAQKEKRLPEYRKTLPGWQIWLVIATHFSVLWSVSVPRDVASWHFDTGFDKVLLSSWEDGVIELQI